MIMFDTYGWRSLTAVDFYRRFGYQYKNNVTTSDEFGVVRLEKIRVWKEETLKKKIAIHNNSKKNVKNENVKEIIKIQNLKNVSHRYKSIGNGIKKYQKEIPNVWIFLIF